MKTDTPETDAAHKASIDDTGCVTRMEPKWDTMERLERERDHFKNLVGLATAYVFEDGKQKGIREVVTERDESRALCAQMSQEREHNAMQALMWRSVADGLAKALDELRKATSGLPSTLRAGLATQQAFKALKAFEEARKL